MQNSSATNQQTIANVAIIAVMTALVMLGVLIHIAPTPVGGYIHLGDILIYFAAFAFGPIVGGAAGGLGAALSDILSGYAAFSPISLIVHGLQGYVAGRIAHGTTSPVRLIGALLAGTVIVIVGYFVGEVLFFGYLQPTPESAGTLAIGPAAAEIPWNIVQEVIGALGAVLYLAVLRAYPPLIRNRSARRA
jgi:uncharacterized membrane protein